MFHAVNILSPELMLEAEKMDKHKDLSKFDKGQIVIARKPCQSMSKTGALVGSRAAEAGLCGLINLMSYCCSNC